MCYSPVPTVKSCHFCFRYIMQLTASIYFYFGVNNNNIFFSLVIKWKHSVIFSIFISSFHIYIYIFFLFYKYYLIIFLKKLIIDLQIFSATQPPLGVFFSQILEKNSMNFNRYRESCSYVTRWRVN